MQHKSDDSIKCPSPNDVFIVERLNTLCVEMKWWQMRRPNRLLRNGSIATYGKCLLNVYMWLQRISNPLLYELFELVLSSGRRKTTSSGYSFYTFATEARRVSHPIITHPVPFLVRAVFLIQMHMEEALTHPFSVIYNTKQHQWLTNIYHAHCIYVFFTNPLWFVLLLNDERVRASYEYIYI